VQPTAERNTPTKWSELRPAIRAAASIVTRSANRWSENRIAHSRKEIKAAVREAALVGVLKRDDHPLGSFGRLQLGEVLLEVRAAGGVTNLSKLLPIRVFTPFHFG
jgi:hypothetical protein